MGVCCSCPDENAALGGTMRKGFAYRPYKVASTKTLTGRDAWLPVVCITFGLADENHRLGFDQPTTHVKIRGPGASMKGRTYSIAGSRPGAFEIHVKVYPQGWVSSYLASLQMGDTAMICATQTKTLHTGFSHVGIIMFGVGASECLGGTLQRLFSCPDLKQVVLVLANRDGRDVYFEQDLQRLRATHGEERVVIHHVLSRSTADTEAVDSSLSGNVHRGVRVSTALLRDIYGAWAVPESKGGAEACDSAVTGIPQLKPGFFAVGSRSMIRQTYASLDQLGLQGRLLGGPRLASVCTSTAGE